MPGRGGKLPKLVEWWAAMIKKRNPRLTTPQAIAMAVAAAQRKGYLKKGSLTLTEKGRKESAKYYGKRLPLSIRRVYREDKKLIRKIGWERAKGKKKR